MIFQAGNYLINPLNILYCVLDLEEQAGAPGQTLTGLTIIFESNVRLKLDAQEAGQFWARLKLALGQAPPRIVVPEGPELFRGN